MTVVQRAFTHTPAVDAPVEISSGPNIRVGLLGLGQVGTAVAGLALANPAALGRRIEITSALVRRADARARPRDIPLTTSPRVLFDTEPDVVVEVLGGLEPARTLVLEAIGRRIPVVTANKALLAHHGDEILDAAHALRVPLQYEASVIAGVPFLDTFARRRLAADVTGVTGIVNGTSNYILSQVDRAGAAYGDALADARRLGFAEPDPSKDIDGIDAAEKLVILLRQFSSHSVSPDAVEVSGIRSVTAADIAHARELGGTIKPVVHARWTDGPVGAFAGPAFVPAGHPLFGLEDATNGVCLRDRSGRQVCFTGPGAGPDVTSITILDDVLEATHGTLQARRPRRTGTLTTSSTGWLLRLSNTGPLPPGADMADLLGAYGAWIRRTSSDDSRDGRRSRWLLTYPCALPRITAALSSLSAATGCATLRWRALDLDA